MVRPATVTMQSFRPFLISLHPHRQFSLTSLSSIAIADTLKTATQWGLECVVERTDMGHSFELHCEENVC